MGAVIVVNTGAATLTLAGASVDGNPVSTGRCVFAGYLIDMP